MFPFNDRSSHRRCSEKSFLKKFPKFIGKHVCQSLYFNKETLAQVFSCEFCEISKSTIFHGTPLVAVSVMLLSSKYLIKSMKRKTHFTTFDKYIYLGYLMKRNLILSRLMSIYISLKNNHHLMGHLTKMLDMQLLNSNMPCICL